MSTDFRTIARALQPYVSGTYDLLEAADAVGAVVNQPEPIATQPSPWDSDLAARNMGVLSNAKAVAYLLGDRKILAIKEVRLAQSLGLKEAKDAVESWVVEDYIRQAKEVLAGIDHNL